jgi:hypothetical protein
VSSSALNGPIRQERNGTRAASDHFKGPGSVPLVEMENCRPSRLEFDLAPILQTSQSSIFSMLTRSLGKFTRYSGLLLLFLLRKH